MEQAAEKTTIDEQETKAMHPLAERILKEREAKCDKENDMLNRRVKIVEKSLVPKEFQVARPERPNLPKHVLEDLAKLQNKQK